MKQVLRPILSICLLLIMQNNFAQLYNYTIDHEGFSAYCNPNIVDERLLRASGATGAGDACDIGFNTKGFTTVATFDTSLAGVILKLLPNPMVTVTISSITAEMRITEKGPIYARYSYSIDSGATWINPGEDVTPIINDCGGGTLTGSWDMPDFSSSQLILIKISGFGAIDSAGRLNVTYLTIEGSLEMIDLDGDGYGSYIDCDDTNPDIHPGAIELCNDIDEDCDGIADELTATIWPAGIINICKHDYVTLHSSPGYATYAWLKNGYLIPTETDSTITTDKPGYYQVIVTDGDCSDTSAIQAVAVKDNPFANIFYPEGLDLCFDDSLRIKASYGDTYAWQWYRNDVLIPFENYYKMLATEVGAYHCVITTFYGCSRVTDSIDIIASCRNSDGGTPASLEVYPNPASDAVQYTFNTGNNFNGSADVQLLNLRGQTVINETVSINEGTVTGTLNVNEFASGVYFIKSVSNNIVITKQIIVE